MAVAAAVTLLSACSGGSGGTGAATGTTTESSGPGATTSATATCDADGLPPGLACQTFTSVSGTSSSADVAWLADGTFTVTLEQEGGASVMAVGTPCNRLTVPVTVQPSQLVPDKDKIATTLMACGADATAQEHWVTGFVSQPMTYALDGAQLTLAAADEQVVLEHS